MTANHSIAATLLVAIDISKHRHEVLIGIPGKKRRHRSRPGPAAGGDTALNTLWRDHVL
jgi:hypothetical protein